MSPQKHEQHSSTQPYNGEPRAKQDAKSPPTATADTHVTGESDVTLPDLPLGLISPAIRNLETGIERRKAIIARANRSLIVAIKEVLRERDCLYDDTKIWSRLTGPYLPVFPNQIPDDVIIKAYESGGRVILSCSCIVDMIDVLRTQTGPHATTADYWGVYIQDDFYERPKEPQWIVVPSLIDPATLNCSHAKPILDKSQLLTPRDSVAVRAYKALLGGQPRGMENSYNYTTDKRFVVGSKGKAVLIAGASNIIMR